MQSAAPPRGHKYQLSLREEMAGFIEKGGWRWWAGCLARVEGGPNGGASLCVHPASLRVSWS